jgi:hypothetical protein
LPGLPGLTGLPGLPGLTGLPGLPGLPDLGSCLPVRLWPSSGGFALLTHGNVLSMSIDLLGHSQCEITGLTDIEAFNIASPGSEATNLYSEVMSQARQIPPGIIDSFPLFPDFD